MNFKRYHESRNLFDVSTTIKATNIRAGSTSESNPLGSEDSNNSWDCSNYIAVLPNTTYTVHYPLYRRASGAGLVYFSDMSVSGAILGVTTAAQGSDTFTFTTPNNCNYVRFSWGNANGDDVMFNLGESSLPYEPYGNTWHDIPHYIHNTSTDTITTLPVVLYPNDTSVTVEITGNTGGVGDLVESGEHAGEYIIPIINNGVAINVYNVTALDVSETLSTTIPATDGANTLSVDTTVQPSEVTVNYKGWHPVQSVHEAENGQWD